MLGLSRHQLRGRLGPPQPGSWEHPLVGFLDEERCPVWRYPGQVAVFQGDAVVESWSRPRSLWAWLTGRPIPLRRHSLRQPRAETRRIEGRARGILRDRLPGLVQTNVKYKDRYGDAVWWPGAHLSEQERLALVARVGSVSLNTGSEAFQMRFRVPRPGASRIHVRWSAQALQEMLADLLQHGPALPTRPSGAVYLVPSRTGCLIYQRAYLLAGVEAGLSQGTVLAWDEPSDQECWGLLPRLELTGELTSQLAWVEPEAAFEARLASYVVDRERAVVPLLEEGRPSANLHLAASLARALGLLSDDLRVIAPRPIRSNFCSALATALGGPGAECRLEVVAQDAPDLPFNLESSRDDRFRTLLLHPQKLLRTAEPEPLKDLDEVLARLRPLGRATEDLQGLEEEWDLEVLRRLEARSDWTQSPRVLALHLQELALTASCLDLPLTPARRALVLGVCLSLDEGLRLLSCEGA